MDELNAFVLLDNNLIKLANGFKPHFNIPRFSDYKVSGNLNIPNTNLITLASYMSDEFDKENINEENDEVYNLLKDIESNNIDLDLTKQN